MNYLKSITFQKHSAQVLLKRWSRDQKALKNLFFLMLTWACFCFEKQ